ncbi:MAG: UPF0365 family protein, partial [Gemmatimonadales bacterium]|nr:UPF0365 family protein [Gemmatimonadales bacterium]
MEPLAGTSIIILIAIALGVLILSWIVPIRLWVTAIASGVRVGLGSLVGMRLRKIPPPRIVYPLISSYKAGLPLHTNELESHF